MFTKIYFRFELMPPKDAELNFRGGPWGNFSFTNSYKGDKGQFELSGCGKPNRIVTVKTSEVQGLNSFSLKWTVKRTKRHLKVLASGIKK